MASEEPSRGIGEKVLDELGLVSVYNSSRDIKLLILQRFVRLFAYGCSTLVLVAYLEALSITKTEIGLFMTLTLVGDICISFVLTLIADGFGRKAVLILGSALMAFSGIMFAFFGNYWVLLIAAIVGVISPSGNEIGPFRAIEESIVAHLTLPHHRSDIYAWYSLCGSAGAAFGMVTCGWVMHRLIEGLQWDLVRSYRMVYYFYAIVGLIKLCLALMLSPSVESEKKQEQMRRDANGETETSPLLNSTSGSEPVPSSKKGGLRALLPDVSKQSVSTLVELCLLFALDAFASGLSPLSWIIFFFHSRYGVEEGMLGTIFFVTNIIAAASVIVASSLAKRFGNVKTMVFTHLPSSALLAALPLPNEVHWSLLILILRSCTQQMDVAPRSAFLATIILPAERTAVMGTINVVKTSANSLGPLITGVLADKDYFWVAFICAGSLKICYDLGLLALFKSKERKREQEEQTQIEEHQRQQQQAYAEQ